MKEGRGVRGQDRKVMELAAAAAAAAAVFFFFIQSLTLRTFSITFLSSPIWLGHDAMTA